MTVNRLVGENPEGEFLFVIGRFVVRRVILTAFLLCLPLLVVKPFSAESITCRRSGVFGQAVVDESPGGDKCYRLSWNTKTTTRGGRTVKKEIDFGSVCSNYFEGSIAYRNCRRQAQEFFRDNCKDLREKYKKTKRPYNERYKLDMDCFCGAGHLFRP